MSKSQAYMPIISDPLKTKSMQISHNILSKSTVHIDLLSQLKKLFKSTK